jgi:hypothetical protein
MLGRLRSARSVSAGSRAMPCAGHPRCADSFGRRIHQPGCQDTVTVPEPTRPRAIKFISKIYVIYLTPEEGPERMFQSEARVLIILPRDLVDRARALAGRAMTSMRLPVSLQIVLRALIEEGLRRPTDPGLLANVSRQAETVRRIRREARRRPAGAARGPAARSGRRSS